MAFTKEQLSAIQTRDKSLLVSAAAGSGKTKTLIERIIQSLLRDNSPEDISSILIVTFTNAATDEIKDRVSAALTEALKCNPENKRLERQLTLLPMAKIFTIDGFCNDILKRNADRAGIPQNYRIADTAETEILSFSILGALINAIYEGELTELATADEFAHFAEALTASRRNSELEEVFLKLYEKSKSSADGVMLFRQRAEEYLNGNPSDNKYTSYIKNIVNETAEHYIKVFRTLSAELSSEGKSSQGYASAIDDDILLCRSLLEAESIFEIKNLLSGISYARLPVAKDKTAAQLEAAELRSEFKKEISELSDKFLFYSEDEWQELYKSLGKELTLLADFLEKFDTLYTMEKKKRAILEYSDIERYTYSILYKDGMRSDVAQAIADEYTSVYIDEYQDVNELQNKIFEAVSSPKNRFMVGDIKQSIYGFRSARPAIFASMKKSFPPLEEADGCDTASIFMSQNFRSDAPVIDFANEIFDKLFGIAGESIGYLPEDRLCHSKPRDIGFGTPTKLYLVNKSGEDEDKSRAAKDKECRFVAEKIKELIGKEKPMPKKLDDGTEVPDFIKPSDIAIIMRGNRERMSDYAEALEKLGIPAEKKGKGDFFLNSEVLLALSLLNSIDNPDKDIYLASLMLSPLFGFTADELYRMRHRRDGTLYSCLRAYAAENPEDKKCCAFLDKLAFYRTLSEGMNIDALLLRLYTDTDIITLAEANGGAENLLLLFSYAKSFASSKFKGLYNFIKFINNIIENETQFDTGNESVREDAVTVTTVHSSKGLEYPIVFYVDTDRALSYREASDRIIFSEDFGISMRLRSPGGLAIVDNPIQNVLIQRETRKYFEEELRVMYVALTRAGMELHISGCIPEDGEKYFDSISVAKRFLDSHSIYSVKSVLSLILAAKSAPNIEFFGEEAKPNIECESSDSGADKAQNDSLYSKESDSVGNTDREDKEAGASLAAVLKSRFDFKYPREALTRLPQKLSVSKLSPEVLDGTEGEPCTLSIDRTAEKAEKRGTLPSFISGTEADKSARRGIATHTFMQFFDIESLCKNGAEAELSRLVKEEFISKENAELVLLDEIEKFTESPLFCEMKDAGERIMREFRFNTYLPARIFTQSKEKKQALQDEKILVQGVIDCIIADAEGGLHLIDYKTDRLSKNQLANKALAAEKLIFAHARQLNYYALAIEQIFGKKPLDMRVYSLPLGECVQIPEASDLQ